jgi:hypothetical protein
MEQMTLDGLDRHVQLMEKVIGNLNGNQDQVSWNRPLLYLKII